MKENELKRQLEKQTDKFCYEYDKWMDFVINGYLDITSVNYCSKKNKLDVYVEKQTDKFCYEFCDKWMPRYNIRKFLFKEEEEIIHADEQIPLRILW